MPEPFKPDAASIQIRQKIGLIASMETQIQTLKGIYKNYREFQIKLKNESCSSEYGIQEGINKLSVSKVKLEKEI